MICSFTIWCVVTTKKMGAVEFGPPSLIQIEKDPPYNTFITIWLRPLGLQVIVMTPFIYTTPNTIRMFGRHLTKFNTLKERKMIKIDSHNYDLRFTNRILWLKEDGYCMCYAKEPLKNCSIMEVSGIAVLHCNCQHSNHLYIYNAKYNKNIPMGFCCIEFIKRRRKPK